MLFQPINSGGLGLRDTSHVNLSLLSKQRWRIISAPPSSLLGSTLQTKYIDSDNPTIIRKPYNSSWFWKGIIKDTSLISPMLRWRVGNGSSIPLNHPLWWPMQSRSAHVEPHSTVQDLIMHSNFPWHPISWNTNLVHHLYEPEIARNILSRVRETTVSYFLGYPGDSIDVALYGSEVVNRIDRCAWE